LPSSSDFSSFDFIWVKKYLDLRATKFLILTTALLYQIALTLIPGIGDVSAKSLLAYCGSPEAVYKEDKKSLLKIPGIGSKTALSIINHDTFNRAEAEMKFVEKNDISSIFFTDSKYPERLKVCVDSPILLYFKGNLDFNNMHFISIVGTRSATDFGKEFTEGLVEQLKPYNTCVVSGLAYGIDITAHKQSIKLNVPTVAVVAHGLDRIYPGVHSNIASDMKSNGGILTDYVSGTKPDRENFPKRNRIIAGLSEATIVVEAAKKGGALITGQIASSYNRDVFAVPGRVTDKYSEGCNHLIKTNQASLIQSAKDIEYLLGWKSAKEMKKQTVQKSFFVSLSESENKVVDLLKEQSVMQLDAMGLKLSWPVSKVFPVLTTLELKGVVRSKPGRVYELI